jgi:hypothetical protein
MRAVEVRVHSLASLALDVTMSPIMRDRLRTGVKR